MTSQGSAHARLKRAIAGGNATLVLAAAAEVTWLSLADALAISLVLISDPARYERATVRWHARFLSEVRPSAAEAQLVFAALCALPGTGRAPAAKALISLFDERGLSGLARILTDWLARHSG